jgi:raffinose/stachyose/melibiose transport system permease protein
MKKITRGDIRTILWFLLPGLIIYSLVTIVPILQAGYLSFFDWNGSIDKLFIGLDNYKEIFQPESDYWNAFKNSMIYVIFCCIGQVGIGFALTVLLINTKLRFAKLFRAALYIPCILAPVVIGFLGLLLYNTRFGMVNKLLEMIGLGAWTNDWLGDPKRVIYALVLLHIWQFIGYYTVIFIAAAQGIPPEVLEVAEIDGAVGYKKTLYVIMPLLRPAIMVCLTICIAGTMKVFDQIYIMTKGGPGTASEVLALYMYNNTFTKFRYGFGNAISIVILLTSFVIIVVPRFLIDRKMEEAS